MAFLSLRIWMGEKEDVEARSRFREYAGGGWRN